MDKAGIKSYFRGSTITFFVNGKKYRGASISQEYSLESIERKINRTYGAKDVIQNLLIDHKSQFKHIDDLKEFCIKRQIDVFEKENDLIFEYSGKKIKLACLLSLD